MQYRVIKEEWAGSQEDQIEGCEDLEGEEWDPAEIILQREIETKSSRAFQSRLKIVFLNV